jgi:hypothetical protein
MFYADDTTTNERKHEEDGNRNIIDQEQLAYFLGGDNTDAEAWEMLLDILNHHWPLEDAITEVTEHWADREEDIG